MCLSTNLVHGRPLLAWASQCLSCCHGSVTSRCTSTTEWMTSWLVAGMPDLSSVRQSIVNGRLIHLYNDDSDLALSNSLSTSCYIHKSCTGMLPRSSSLSFATILRPSISTCHRLAILAERLEKLPKMAYPSYLNLRLFFLANGACIVHAWIAA